MKMKKTKTILAIGDIKDWDTFRKFCKQKRFFHRSKFNFKSMNYFDLLDAKFPKINTEEVIVFPFFPFEYWDKYIEPKNYKGVYGNSKFFTKFTKFWKEVEKKIEKNYSDKKVKYINHPKSLALDRDKELTKELVNKGDYKSKIWEHGKRHHLS